MKYKIVITMLLTVLLAGFGLIPAICHADDNVRVYTKGDGFTIDQKDLDVENSFLSSDFQTTDDQKVNSLLRNRLFTLEAKKLKDPLIDKKAEIMTEKFYGILYGEKIRNSIVIGDDVLKSYYLANPDEFTVPPQYNLNMLMVKQEIICNKIREDLLKGKKDFLAAVKESSLDEDTRNRDGSMGWITEAQLPKEIWNYVAPLEKGKVSESCLYGENWLLFQLVDKKPGYKRDFESAKEEIRNKLVNKNHIKKMDEEFERLKKEYHVVN